MVHCAAGTAARIIDRVDAGKITQARGRLEIALDPARKGFRHLTIER